MSKFQPTAEQRAIFEELEKGRSHVVVVARAGTGKTTTLVEGVGRAPERNKLLCAFNKDIARELKLKVKDPACEVRTLHSLGLKFVTRSWGRVKVDDWRGRDIAQEVAGNAAPREVVTVIANLAKRAKGEAPFATLDDLESIALANGFLPSDEDETEGYDLDFVCRKAHEAMERATEKTGRISFADMVYLPVRLRLVRPFWDLVLVDECQDMNAAQIALARAACKKRGRIVAVGDNRQAIYGFRGADSHSLSRLSRELGATELSLTVTFRCARAIVEKANTLVPDYYAAEGAEEGLIRQTALSKVTSEAKPGDFILSRKNAPLATLCLKFLREGKAAFIAGKKDIAKALTGTVKQIAKKRDLDLTDFSGRLAEWTEREIKKAERKGEKGETRIDFVGDLDATLRALSEGLATTSELIARIDSMFAEVNGRNAVVLSSVHKAKGLEADTVFLLAETFSDRNEEERNIRYVAITRAKSELVMVTG